MITKISFDVEFLTFDGVELDVTGFAFAVPYLEEAATVQITHEEKVLAEVTPMTKLLHNAVDLIPNYGFINNPE